MPTTIKLVGGPRDSEILTIAEELVELRMVQQHDHRAEPLTYRRVPAWTDDGLLIYVHSDHRKSLIGDHLLAMAAGWLADRHAEFALPERMDREAFIDLQIKANFAELRRVRDQATNPAAGIVLRISIRPGLRIRVVIYPSVAFGFVDENQNPTFVYSPQYDVFEENGMSWLDAIFLIFGRPIPDGRPRNPTMTPHPLPLPG
jgi:hypothetical protein